MKFNQVNHLKGELTIPGDKSVSHRSIMLGSLAKGTTRVTNFLEGADCLLTIALFRRMGIEIERSGSIITVHGNGLHGLKKPDGILDCGNSGTTIRLISGIFAAQDFDVVLTGDESIQRRPMKRIITPLSQMGARIESTRHNDCAPLAITGSKLHGIHYQSPVASAQIKSAILLAGLYADGQTSVTEPVISRDHSERMLTRFGAAVSTTGTTATISPVTELYGTEVKVPGDISSAAFFIAAATLVPGSELIIRNVGINPTRDGIIKVCRAMGADIQFLNHHPEAAEPYADLLVRSSRLHGTTIEGSIIPTLIDELPIIAAMACFAEGETVIRDAAEMKVKESNRIEVMVRNLSAMGADITETEDGMIIRGGRPLHGAVIDSNADHRIAMTFAITALCAEGTTEIQGAECVEISYPTFYKDLQNLIQ